MHQSIFKTSQLSQRSFFQRIFRQHPQENAVIELNNLLASKSIMEIQKKEVAAIENKYRLNLEREFKLNIEEFYAVYLNSCLKDKILSNEEISQLQHLKFILNLDDKSINILHLKIGEIVYKKSFEDAVSDGRLTEQEEAFLSKLETALKLPKQIAEKISSETRTKFIQNHVATIVNDQRLSPNEEKELEAIAKSLNVTIELNKETKEQLQKLKLYWALENLELPATEPEINLQRNECCYIIIQNVNWHELRTTRQRVSYGGYSTSLKVAKAFYLRSGTYKPTSYTADEIKLIDRGTVYLTNKRILFTGIKKNSIIRLDKILNIIPYIDGLEIDKETGKCPLLILPDRSDIFCIILERLLRERNF